MNTDGMSCDLHKLFTKKPNPYTFIVHSERLLCVHQMQWCKIELGLGDNVVTGKK